MATFLSVVPHPDDEVVAAGPVCLDLLLRGHAVHVLCLSLGRSQALEGSRREELQEAAAEGGWNLVLPAVPVQWELGGDFARAEEQARAAVGGVLRDIAPDVVLSPSPQDRHPGHEAVGRVVSSLGRDRTGLRWWAWSVWGHLVEPTLLHPFGPQVLGATLRAHAAHRTQIERNDYREMLIGASASAAVLGPEQVFGFGSGVSTSAPYASVFSEVLAVDGAWVQGLPRVLDVDDPVGMDWSRRTPTWVDAPSPYAHLYG